MLVTIFFFFFFASVITRMQVILHFVFIFTKTSRAYDLLLPDEETQARTRGEDSRPLTLLLSSRGDSVLLPELERHRKVDCASK